MKEVDPKQTKRAAAYELWMNVSSPTVTIFKTLDVTRLAKQGRRRGYKFNALLCHCIGRAASQMQEFYLLPVGEQLIVYERLAVGTMVPTKSNRLCPCDIPFSWELKQFHSDYLSLTQQVYESGEAHSLRDDSMVIATDPMIHFELDGVVNAYGSFSKNPNLIWSHYQKKWGRFSLRVSFQFHHTQLDLTPAAWFLTSVQKEIDALEF